jgi:hypothetical protein
VLGTVIRRFVAQSFKNITKTLLFQLKGVQTGTYEYKAEFGTRAGAGAERKSFGSATLLVGHEKRKWGWEKEQGE